MPLETLIHETPTQPPPRDAARPADPCLLVIFGASGDLTKRLLMPAIYNLTCDGLLPKQFAIVGLALDPMSTEQFRARMSEDIKKFNTRPTLDAKIWEDLVGRLYYLPGNFGDPDAYRRLGEQLTKLDGELRTGGNLLFYFATPPSVFALISDQLSKAGFIKRERGWTRVIVEKPFGHDLPSAQALNKSLAAHWHEDQIYRIDHYLGKETVQNLLAFRFSNGIYEPLWNKNHVDHIQMTVDETVGVETRGGYYDKVGVLRDMIQNHMFQMLAYMAMEPPASFKANAIRNEKAKLLDSVRIMTPEEVARNTVRGQYGPGKKADGSPALGYRQEMDVNPESATETYAALKLSIDNWRWDGVPVYLRSGKNLWKRGTEIVVQFKVAPEVLFRDTPVVGNLESNRLIFHIQPEQAIEFRFHAKAPGPTLNLQKVNMRFDYREAFEASRGTGYEVMLYNCMIGDATLFSRSDLVESAWRVTQPILDYWANTKPTEFPNYPAGSWGPKASYDLLARDGRRWVEVINRDVLEKVPLFRGQDKIFLRNLSIMLKPVVYPPGEFVIRKGEQGGDMYIVSRGELEVLDGNGQRLNLLREGDFFGELSLLTSKPRAASIRAVTPCDLFVLEQWDFKNVLKEHRELADSLKENARNRYPGVGL